MDIGEGGRPTTMDSVIRAIARVDAAPAVAVIPGQILDDTYELVERLGGGGMGVVFQARDRRLGRAVAVKILKRTGGTGDDHLRRLFEREARATAQLLHPNIVTLHHVGEHDGSPYLVLELLTGETLAARLVRRRRLPVDDALAILDAVLAALAFAHERGVLHRDLKPTNVFITADERVKVLDFGVALSIDTDPGPVTRAAGTPGYMAPEQRDGGAQDARTDVWAAAVLLVECLTGTRPDDGDVARAIAGVDAPVDVRAQLARALAADPAARPATANDLRAALARASARLAPTVDRPRRWRRRASIGALAAATGVAGVVAGALAFGGGDPPPRAIAAGELAGTWKTNFDRLVLEVADDGATYGVYEHDDGILVGRYRDNLFMGRWCELPSRRGPKDAGWLQLHFARTGTAIVVDGRWTYGDAPDVATGDSNDVRWRSAEAGFYGSRTDLPRPAGLAARIAERAPCP